MIEKTILDYLASCTGCPVYMERPREAPEKYVLIEKTGSSMQNMIRTATMAVQSVDASLYGAALLSSNVVGYMLNADIENVFDIELNSDYNFTNANTKEYRYQAVFNITYKE